MLLVLGGKVFFRMYIFQLCAFRCAHGRCAALPLHHPAIISTTTDTTLIDKATCSKTTDSKLMTETSAFITTFSLFMPQSYARIFNDTNLLYKICHQAYKLKATSVMTPKSRHFDYRNKKKHGRQSRRPCPSVTCLSMKSDKGYSFLPKCIIYYLPMIVKLF